MDSLKKNRRYYGWIILFIWLLAIAAAYTTRFTYSVFFTSLEQDFHSNRMLISTVFSVQLVLGALFAIVGGWIADRYGHKYVLPLIGIFTFLGLIGTSRSSSMWQLFLTYGLLVAMGTGPAFVVATSATTKWFKKNRGLAIAIVASGMGLGSIIITPVSAWLMEINGWRFSAATIGLITLAIIIPASVVLFIIEAKISATKSETDRDSTTKHSDVPKNEKTVDSNEFSFWQITHNRNFVLILLVWAFYSFCMFLISTHLVPHALDLNITAVQAASLVSVIGFANIPSRLLSGVASDKLGRKPLAVINALIMTASLALLLFPANLGILYVFAILFGIGYGGLAAPIIAMVGDIFGVRHMGKIMGILEIGWVLGAAAGPALAGYVYDTSQSYQYAFIVTFIISLFVVIMLLAIRIPGVNKTSRTA